MFSALVLGVCSLGPDGEVLSRLMHPVEQQVDSGNQEATRSALFKLTYLTYLYEKRCAQVNYCRRRVLKDHPASEQWCDH